MPKIYSGVPLVEVIAPDGSKSFWAAAVGQKFAVKVVQMFVPPDHIAKFSGQRLPVDPVLEGIRRGEVRKVLLAELGHSPFQNGALTQTAPIRTG
jgi:hypothetical protein